VTGLPTGLLGVGVGIISAGWRERRLGYRILFLSLSISSWDLASEAWCKL